MVNDEGMTFASEQLTRLETLLAEHPGVQSFTIGNTSVSYDDLVEQREYWKRQVALEDGSRKRLSRINLSNF